MTTGNRLASAIALLGLLAPDIILPDEWGGIWSTEETEIDCQTEIEGDTFASIDTLCVGDVWDFEDPEFNISCDETVDGQSISIHCAGVWQDPELPDCQFGFEYFYDATRDGDTITYSDVVIQTIAGDECPFPQETCIRFDGVSTRIGPEPESCGTPVEAQTWSAVKALYH